MNKLELAQKVKQKYPQYAKIDDNVLADKVLEKYPVYRNQIQETATQTEPKSVGGFLGNVLTSAARPENIAGAAAFARPEIAGAMAVKPAFDLNREAIARPLESIFSKLGYKYQSPGDVAANLTGKIMGKPLEMQHQTPEQVGVGTLEYGKQAYGSPAKIAQTAYENPVGTAMDALSLILPIKAMVGKGSALTAKMSPAKSETLVKSATNTYREILKPIQSEVKNVEIRGNKNIDDYYKLAAEEKLPIKESADKRIDTRDALAKLEGKQEQIHQELNGLLSKSDKTFDLSDVAVKVGEELKTKYKNASEYNEAVNNVQEFLTAEAQKYGTSTVTAQQLNEIKQGMWQVGYNQLKPTANKTARTIGHIAKEMIEEAVSDPTIKSLNQKSGDYATLTNLLNNAHGRVVKAGKIGKYVGNVVGAGAGAALGSMIPIPGVGTATGTLIGAGAGGKIAGALASPERMSNAAINKINRVGAQQLTPYARLMAAIAARLSSNKQ